MTYEQNIRTTYRSSPSRNRPTIGVLAGWQVHAGIPDSFLHQVFRGINAAVRDNDVSLLLAYSIGRPRGIGLGRPAWPLVIEEADFVPVGPWNVDGLIIAPPIVPSTVAAAYFQDLQGQGYPIVYAGSGLPGPSIIPDNELGIRQAMEHLVAHGHTRIAFVAGHRNRVDSDSGSRLAAYRAFLEEHGLMRHPDLVAYSAHTTPGGRHAMRQILDADVPFTAVLASNDLAAVGAREVLQEAGLSVPEDVALIGFDDRVEATAMVPQLTTVHYPIFEVGYQAVLLMLRYLKGEVVRGVVQRVPTRLVVRGSCGCLPGEKLDVLEPPAITNILQAGSRAPEPLSASAEIASATETLTTLVFNLTHGLHLGEVRELCSSLVVAFRESVATGQRHAFLRSLKGVLERVMIQGDGLEGWQAAITGLREHTQLLWPAEPADRSAVAMSDREIEDMLHQARYAISEAVQGQRAREAMRQADTAYQLYQMTARFQTAREESDIIAALQDTLPQIGIRDVAVALYEAQGNDPVAYSILQTASSAAEADDRFPSREFPPPGLYPDDVPFRLALTPLLHQGTDLIGFVAFDMGNLDLCADITWLLAAALHGLRSYRAAVEGRRLAEEANRLKSRFLSMVSHELRTPLNLITGLSDLLLRESGRRDPANNGLSEDLERIYVNAQHLDDLLCDVLDLARSEVGQLRLTREPLSLNEVVEPVSVIAQMLVRDKALTWRTEIPEDMPWVWGDQTRLRQVLLNLVNNAVKFTSRGEVALRVTAHDGTVRVSVKDTGLGIPLEEQHAIFDEFRQSERTTARGYGGLGLGLAICKRLIEMHGGEIGVSSSGEVGAGSEFYFVLPTTEPPEESTAECEPLPATSQSLVLLVRDLQAGHDLRSKWLQQGFEVVVHSAEEDHEWFDAVLAEPPSAVIVDQELAATGGWEILRRLKETPGTRRVPVLLLGGRESDHAAFLELDLLTKPVGTTELGEALAAQGLSLGDADQPADRTILVVDDDLSTLEMHTRIVQQQSPAYNVLQARDGYEALDLIHKTSPDLVLLDLMMPGLDGFGVLRAMREDAASRRIPVIILTAQTLTEEDMALLNQGIVSVLSKGLFTEEETQQHLAQVLARQRRAASETQGFVLEAMAYIHMHYMDPISRSDVADHVGVSERHLSRCFRREIGVTPISYLNRYRVRQAKRLLEAGVMGITDVAMAVGFSSGGYFSRVFRQEMGVSPLAYQRGECAATESDGLS